MKNVMKSIKNNNAFLSLISILSLILATAVICACVMGILYKVGLYELPWFLNKSTGEPETTDRPDTLDALLDGKEITRGYSSVSGDTETLKKLLMSTPFAYNYFAEARVTYISYDKEITENYEIYRDKDKFRISVYSDKYIALKTIVCDGKRVSVTDKTNGSSVILSDIGELSFDVISPMPVFSLLSLDENNIIYSSEEDTEHEIICEFPEQSVVLDVRISSVSGMVTSARTYCNNSLIIFYELTLCEKNISFGQTVFDVS